MDWSPQQAEYYVYEHVRLDTGLPFYVGKGKGDRSHCHYNRNRYWSNIVAKHGFSVRIVAGGLDEELSFLAEIELIDQYRRLGIKLANMTAGGDGVSLIGEAKERFLARQRDPEVNRRRAESTRKALAPKEVRERMSAGIRRALEREDYREKLRENAQRNNARPEVRQKISESAKAYWSQPGVKDARLGPLLAASKEVCAKPVLCIETGITYPSFADAAAWLRAKVNPKASHSAIVNACKGKLKSAYGYRWRYANTGITRAAERVTVVV